MADDNVDVKIKAHVEEYLSGMNVAREATTESVERMKASLESLTTRSGTSADAMRNLWGSLSSFKEMGEVTESVHAFSGALAGMAGVAAVALPAAIGGLAIEQFTEVGASLYGLSRQTGITVEDLDVMRQVAVESGVSMEELGGSINRFQRALRQAQTDTSAQAQALDSLGVKLTDANGKTKDTTTLFNEVAGALANSKDGWEKNAIGMQLFGRSGATLNKFLEEYAERGNRTAVVTTEMAEKAEHLEKAWNSIKLAGTNALVNIGDGILNFKDTAVEAAESVGKTFKFLWASMTGDEAKYWEEDRKQTEEAKARAEERKKAEESKVQRHFDPNAGRGGKDPTLDSEINKATLDILKESGATESQLIDVRLNLMAATGKYSAAQIEMLRSLEQTAQAEKEANKAPGEAMKEATAALEQMKLARKAALDPATGEEELEFWNRFQSAIDTSKLSAEQYAALQKNILTAQAATAEEAEKETKKALDELRGDREAEIRADAEAQRQRVEAARRALQEQAALHQVSKDEQLRQEREFALQIGVIDQQQFEALANLYGDDLKKHQQYLTEKEKAEGKAADEISKIQVKQIQEQESLYAKALGSISSAFTSSFDGLIKGTANWTMTAGRMVMNLADTAIRAAERGAAEFIKNEILKLTMQKEGQAVAVQSEASKAAAGAYSAVVGIPYVGPVLAPAAAATAYVAVEAFAERGYDIPAGVNPVVQAHQREMILPAEHADTIRSLGKSGGGGGGAPTFHIHAQDSADVASFLRRHGSKVADVVSGRISGSNFRPAFL